MPTFVALLRGINVGKAKRVPMAELRALLSGLGYKDVATLLNSSNCQCPQHDVVSDLRKENSVHIKARLVLLCCVLLVAASPSTTALQADAAFKTSPVKRCMIHALVDPNDDEKIHIQILRNAQVIGHHYIIETYVMNQKVSGAVIDNVIEAARKEASSLCD